MATRRSQTILALALSALALSGCVRFGGKPPESLLTLTYLRPVTTTDAMTTDTGGPSITVMDPEAARPLDNVRVSVLVTDTTIAYVQKAQWSDTPRHLFRKLLSEALVAQGGLLVLDPAQYSVNPGQRLMGELIAFGIDARGRMAVVTYEATLTNGGGTQILRRRFSASAPVRKIDAANVAAPLNAAANQVASEAAQWVLANKRP